MGRIEVYNNAEFGPDDLDAREEIYGLRYLSENDDCYFGWAHATDVQVAPGADPDHLDRFRSLEENEPIGSFALVTND